MNTPHPASLQYRLANPNHGTHIYTVTSTLPTPLHADDLKNGYITEAFIWAYANRTYPDCDNIIDRWSTNEHGHITIEVILTQKYDNIDQDNAQDNLNDLIETDYPTLHNGEYYTDHEHH